MTRVDPRNASLKQLQELEKNHTDFSAQVSELRRILNRDASGESSSRAQWALKWALKKLRSSDGGGQRARNALNAWDLVDNVVADIPVATLAQILQQHNFLAIVADALVQCCDADTAEVTEPSQRETIGGKRKASADSVPHPKRQKRSLQANTISESSPQSVSERLRKIITVLRALNDRCKPRGGSNADVQHLLRSVLRAEHEVARKILLSGLRAVDLLAARAQNQQGRDAIISTCLQTILAVWEQKRVSPNYSKDLSEVFDSEAVMKIFVNPN